MTAATEDKPPVPGPTDAEDKLTEELKARGMQVMDPQWGYRMIVQPDGLLLPPFADIPTCHELRERFEIRSHDVSLVTYPKCGTAWMQQLLCLLTRGSDTDINPLEDAKWYEATASMAKLGSAMVIQNKNQVTLDDMINFPVPDESTSGYRVWKTHSPLGSLPWKGGIEQAQAVGSKIVIVSRNPKDTAISKFHHTKKLKPMLQFDGEWEQFAPLFLAGRVSHNSYWDWHRDWWLAKEKYPENILWLQFEDMKKDLEKEIRRVAVFLNLERSDEEIKKVTERCTFSSMKAESKERNDTSAKKEHFRSGKSGGWASFMSEETIAEFDAKTEKMYSDCSFRFSEK